MQTENTLGAEEVTIWVGDVEVAGNLETVEGSQGTIIFAHGSGSSRFSRRNQYVARVLQKGGFSTLLMDLLTPEEEAADIQTAQFRFDISLLAERVVGAIDWLENGNIGLFGSSTGAAAALEAASVRDVAAVVSRGGRPDLAKSISKVNAPTLFIVGEQDTDVIELNRLAMSRLNARKKLVTIPGATHLFPEPGALEEVAALATEWFSNNLK